MIISINARRWFQKYYGNTYHSVTVHVDGKFIAYMPFAYGYGEQYMQTAHFILQNAGIYPRTDKRLKSGVSEDWYNFCQDKRNGKHQFVINCTDVARKKDL